MIEIIPLRQTIGIDITPDGKYAYVSCSSKEIYVIETNTNTVVDTIPLEGNPWGLAVTPDGKYVYAISGTDKVSVINTTTNAVETSIAVGDFPM